MTPYDATGRGTMPTAGACEIGQTAQAKDPAYVTIDNATLMFPHLLTPTTFRGRGPEYYGCCLGVPKDDRATIDRLYAAVRVAIDRYVKSCNVNFGRPYRNDAAEDDEFVKLFPTTIHNGELEHPGDARYAPYILVNCKTYEPPNVVDANCQPITDPAAVQHGMMCRATVWFGVYTYQSKCGVKCTLTDVKILD